MKVSQGFVGIAIIFLIIIFLWGISPYVIFSFLKYEHGGVFGDSFGAINSLFSGLAFAAIIYTIWQQKEQLKIQSQDLKLTREEMELTRQEFKAQNETMALQRFENMFFKLLELHYTIFEHLGNNEQSSRSFFNTWYVNFQNQYEENKFNRSFKNHFAEHVIGIHRNFGNYILNLERIFKFIEYSSLTPKQKTTYSHIVVDQINESELRLLYYYCNFFEEKALSKMAVKYNLFENYDSGLYKYPNLKINKRV